MLIESSWRTKLQFKEKVYLEKRCVFASTDTVYAYTSSYDNSAYN